MTWGIVAVILMLFFVGCGNDTLVDAPFETPQDAVKPYLTGDTEQREVFNGFCIIKCLNKYEWRKYWTPLEWEYLAYTRYELYLYAYYDDLDTVEWNKFYDCNRFSLSFVGHCYQAMRGIPIGVIYYGEHMAVIFYDYYNDELLIIDPQNDKITPPNPLWDVKLILM